MIDLIEAVLDSPGYSGLPDEAWADEKGSANGTILDDYRYWIEELTGWRRELTR